MAERNWVARVVLRGKDELSGVIGGIQAKLAALSAALLSLVGIKLFSDSVQSAKDMETQLGKVQAKGGYTAAELESLRAAAERLGQDFGVGGQKAAEALEVLAAAGLSADASLKVLPAVLALAKTEGLGLEQAATLLGDSLSVLGLGFDQAGRGADVLVKGANISKTSAAELGAALKVAGGEAKTAGLSLEQTVALLDALAERGLRGAEAGTAVRNILAQLGDPASNARRELALLGDTSGSLTDALDTIVKAGGRGEAAVRAFGLESGPALRALLATGTAGIGDYVAQLLKAGGAADDVAQKMGANLAGAWERFTAALDRARRTLVEPLLAPLAKELDGFTAQVRDFVTGGGLDEFRNAIVQGFTKASESARQFIGDFDFKAALAKAGEFARQFSESMQSIANAGRTAADTVKLGWNALLTGAQVLGAGVAKAASVVVEGLAGIERAASKVGLGSEERARDLEVKAEGLRGVYEELSRAATDSAGRVRAAWDGIAGSVTNAGDKQAAAGQKAATAARLTTAAVDDELAAYAKAAEAARDAGIAATEAAAGTKAAENDKLTAYNASREAAQALREEARRLAAAGDTSAAAAKLKEYAAALAALKPAAQDSGKAVADAYTQLGLKTQQQLNQAASNARANFETIKNSGTASAGDVRRAFLKYAESALDAARAAGDGSEQTVQAQLASQAAVLGVTAEYLRLTGATDQAADATQRLIQLRQQMQQGGGGPSPVQTQAEGEKKAVIAATNAFADFTAEILSYGVAAAELFDANLHAAGLRELSTGLGGVAAAAAKSTDTLEGMRATLKRLEAETHAGGANETDSNIAAWGRAANATRRALLEAAIAVKEVEERLQSGSASAADLARAESIARESAHLLGQERLQPLRDAIDSARQKLEALRDSARSTVDSLRDELDQLDGDTVAIEQRRVQKQQADLAEQLKAARAAKDQLAIADLLEAQRIADQVHRKRLEQIDTERRAQQQRDAGAGRSGSGDAGAATASQTPTRVYELKLTDPAAGQRSLRTIDDPGQFLGALERAGVRSAR